MLYDAMTNDKDPEVRQAVASNLGEIKARVAIPKLKAAMDKDPEVGFVAARLHDPNGLASMGAVEGAGALLVQQCDPESASSIGTTFVDDKNEVVRAGAARALGTCGGKRALPKLTDAVSSEKFSVQIAATASLIRLSGALVVAKAPVPASLQKK